MRSRAKRHGMRTRRQRQRMAVIWRVEGIVLRELLTAQLHALLALQQEAP